MYFKVYIYEKEDEYSKIKIMDEKNIMLHYVDYLMELSFVRIVKIIFLVQKKEFFSVTV